MTRVALRRSCHVATRMASNAHQPNMGSSQRETGCAMIESRRLPGSGRVTLCAQMREAVRDVIRIRNRCKIALVAAIAISRRVGVSRGMASDTLQPGVPAREREPGSAMIESRRRPCRSGVTGHTIVVKVVGCVVRICDSFKVALMAGVTSRGGICISRSVT